MEVQGLAMCDSNNNIQDMLVNYIRDDKDNDDKNDDENDG